MNKNMVVVAVIAIMCIFPFLVAIDRNCPRKLDALEAVLADDNVSELNCSLMEFSVMYDQAGLDWTTYVDITCYSGDIRELHKVEARLDYGDSNEVEVEWLKIDGRDLFGKRW